MDGDTGGIEPLGFFRCSIDGAGGFDVDAELVLAEAGGDVGMGFGEDVGVDAEGEAGALAEGFGAGSEEVEFGLGFDVEEEDVGAESGVHFPGLFAYSGEDYFFEGRRVGFADALEFAAGDDVKACALFGEESQDGKGRVGFDSVADGVGALPEGLVEELEAMGDLICRVDVERCAEFFGERGETGLVAVKCAVAIDEGAWIGGDLFGQHLALCREGVRGFGDNDPCDEIGDGADAGEECEERGEDADKSDVPVVVLGETGADSGDDTIVARAGELTGDRRGSVWRWRGRCDGGSTGCAEAGGWIDLLAALGTEHFVVSGVFLFCHIEIRVVGVVRSAVCGRNK